MTGLKNVVGVVLAGGKGERLFPLTKFRSKPAVPFGGKYRILDFVMNSFVNSGIKNIKILVQAKSQSLIQHIQHLYPSVPNYGYFVDSVPAQQMIGEGWYEGTADAVYQNLDRLRNKNFTIAAIFSGDHVFCIDVEQMYAFHLKKKSEFTICAIPFSVEIAAGQFGIIEVDESGRVIGFEEKPLNPKEIPGKPGMCFASMGNYLANIPCLSQFLYEDANDASSRHDFGENVIPTMLKAGEAVYAYDFSENKIKGQTNIYWRDVGTIYAYWDANMDLRTIDPKLNLYNVHNWPIRTFPDYAPPYKQGLKPIGNDNLISGGCITNGTNISGSVLSSFVKVEKNSSIVDSVIFSGVSIGENAHIQKCIIDKGVIIPSRARIGFSQKDDEERGFHVKDGITVVPFGAIIK